MSRRIAALPVLLLAAPLAAPSALALALPAAGCARCAGDAAPRERLDLLLAVDGLEIPLADLQAPLAYLDAVYPADSRNTKVRRILETHLVPLYLARRAFAERRAEVLGHAKALKAAAGNVVELEQALAATGERYVGRFPVKRRTVVRSDVELPVAQYLFDPLTTGGTSDPIEVPQGWLVVAARKLDETPLVAGDVCDAIQVGFTTHDLPDFHAWFEAEKKRLAGKATWVHPDHRAAMPAWLEVKP